jgi:hypothetical protein
MTVATAVQVAQTWVFFAYPIRAAADVTPWTIVTSRIAFAACALYAGSLFRAMDRHRAALAMRGLAAAFVGTAVFYLLGQGDWLGRWLIPASGAATAGAAVVAGISLRFVLRD